MPTGPRVLPSTSYLFLPLATVVLVLCLAAGTTTTRTISSPYSDSSLLEFQGGMTSNVHEKSLGPGTLPFDVENYPVAPEGLELEQVHLYVRHGECE